jgi:hypothetical protein
VTAPAEPVGQSPEPTASAEPQQTSAASDAAPTPLDDELPVEQAEPVITLLTLPPAIGKSRPGGSWADLPEPAQEAPALELSEDTEQVGTEPAADEQETEAPVTAGPIEPEPIAEADGPAPQAASDQVNRVDASQLEDTRVRAEPALMLIQERCSTWLRYVFGWVRPFWSGICRLWPTDATDPDLPATEGPQAATEMLETTAGPWWFDYPDPWCLGFDWTWLALAEREPSSAILEPPDDIVAELERALLESDADTHLAAWSSRNQ